MYNTACPEVVSGFIALSEKAGNGSRSRYGEMSQLAEDPQVC